MENLQKEFVPYELALRMKQLGFNESCFAFYNGKHLDLGIWDWEYPAGQKRRDIGECPQAPLFQQAFRWFRDEHGMSGSIQIEHDAYQWSIFEEGETSGLASDNWDGTDYEEAELACLEKLLEIVEQNGKDKSET
jgi:hypothetical protein